MASPAIPRMGRFAVAMALGALAVFIIGRTLPNVIEEAVHQGILDQVVWRPDSPPEVDARYRGAHDSGGEPDYFRVWMWNLTNLAEVRKGAKPKLVEVGPLTYRKYRTKLDTWWDQRGRLSFKKWEYHIFQPELSAASPNDSITTLNLPLLGVLETLHAHSASAPAVRPLLDVLVGVLSGWRDEHVNGLFTTRTAGELLWGYEDSLLQRLTGLLGPMFVPSSTVRLVPNDTAEEVMSKQAPCVLDTGWRPTGWTQSTGSHNAVTAPAGRRGGAGLRVPYWSRRNEYDEERIWNMEAEAGWTQVTSWGANCTERVRGSDAFQFRPGLTAESKPRAWIAEIFRSGVLTFQQEMDLYGVKLLRFRPDPSQAAPDPCHHQHIQGLANVTVPMAVGPNGDGSSEAAHGVPLLLSQPHYCEVDPSVPAALEGIACDPARHLLFLDVEPTTGITMRAAKRVQLSSQLSDSARTTLEPYIGAPLILPIFWAEEAAQISASHASTFRTKLYGAQRSAGALRRWSYLAAAVLVAAAGVAVVAAWLAAREAQRTFVGHLDRAEGHDGDGGISGRQGWAAAAPAGSGGRAGNEVDDRVGDGAEAPLLTAAEDGD